ncbi:MAG: nucleotidyltransferase family protein [Deltaproteobacteria bacterium]|nr:nucleotidyltransferase family protein [Deltaproteobacteria bacterium]
MNLSNENNLLLCCIQTETSESKSDRIKKLLTLPLNWEEILQSAFWHGITPLLYHSLKGIEESKLIPQIVMDQLKTDHHRNIGKNMHFYAELSGILKAFRENRIKVIVLKGGALAQTVYGNIALRPMSDIDLLIKTEDLSHAEKIMSDLGYLFEGNKPLEWYRENHFHLSYFHPEKTILVEIHWHIGRASHPSQIAITDTGFIERWWERTRTVEISGMKTLLLCPDDLLVHLSLHFIKHRFISGGFKGPFTSRGALIQLCDIFQILKHYKNEFNWARLQREAEEYGITSLISSTLYLLREIMDFDDGIFNDAFRVFKLQSFEKELTKLIQKRIFIIEDSIPSSFIQSLVADRFQNQVKSLLRTLFPHREVFSKRYSVPLSSKKLYFYYLIRPFILLLKYRKLLWRSLISRGEVKEEVILNRWINSKN